MMPRRMLILLLVPIMSGCGFFSRAENHFFSLDTIPTTAPAAGVAGSPVGIDGVELPPGLDRREVVVRDEEHSLDIRGTHQWVSPLEEMVVHTLAFNLANRLPEGMVILPGQAKPVGAMRSIYVVFEDLTPGPEPVFVLDARWTLTANGQPTFTRHERIEIPVNSLESADVASGMSRALAELADRITQFLASA